MRHLHYARWVCLLFLFAMLGGCSSAPSVSEGRKVFEQVLRKESRGLIKVVNFSKTNGQEGNVNGIKTYKMEFEAEIEFIDNCYWAGNDFGYYLLYVGMKREPDPLAFRHGYGRAGLKGQRAKVSGAFVLEKMEKGWRLVGIRSLNLKTRPK